jgi:hypothetical protein
VAAKKGSGAEAVLAEESMQNTLGSAAAMHGCEQQ